MTKSKKRRCQISILASFFVGLPQDPPGYAREINRFSFKKNFQLSAIFDFFKKVFHGLFYGWMDFVRCNFIQRF